MALEVRHVTARVLAPVLRQKDAVRLVGPSWASLAHVLGTELRRQPSVSDGTPYVIDEPTHTKSVEPRTRIARRRQYSRAPVCCQTRAVWRRRVIDPLRLSSRAGRHR